MSIGCWKIFNSHLCVVPLYSTPFTTGPESAFLVAKTRASKTRSRFAGVHALTHATGLCQRRHWPEPLFQTFRTRYGYGCTVRVNNREYSTDVEYESDELAKNAAATRAYMICRNFSVNDGMYPGQRPGQGGVVQGLPVAIGTGRRNTASSNEYDSNSSSGGTSPRNSDCGLDGATDRRGSKSSATSASSCFCGRGAVRAYERCTPCLREHGYQC
jgi:hypothetical protein